MARTMSDEQERTLRDSDWPDAEKWATELDATRARLAAQEAECADLREVAICAQWLCSVDGDVAHTMMVVDEAEVPFGKMVDSALSRPPGTDAALRAMLEGCARLTARMAFSASDAGGDYETFAKVDLPLIPARLLPATQAQGENERGSEG